MKQYIKGIITGFMAACILSAIPSLADTADMVFNSVRINVGGVDKIQWGEEIQLDNGTTAPGSILYNGTTYLPLRKTAQILGNDVSWNGDTNTVTICSNTRENKIEIAKKPDANGNIWTYYIYSDAIYHYLAVHDETRGYERIYLMASDSVRVTDNEIYFVRLKQKNAYRMANEADIIKLSFANDKNTQDGESIQYLPCVKTNDVIFDGDYLIYSYPTPGTHSKGVINILNYMSNDGSVCTLSPASWESYTITSVTDSTDTSVTINFHHATNSTVSFDGTVVFDKTTNTFGEPIEVEK